MSESLHQRILQRLATMAKTPKKSLGQNFLVSQHVVDKIVAATQAHSFDLLIEIGPGLGSLTESLLTTKTPLVLIELDRGFAEYWQTHSSAKVLAIDALQAPWGELLGGKKTVLVSNLPYQISSRLVIELSVAEASPQRMVLMFQKEVAKRILAPADHPDYSLLSFMAQVFWRPQHLLEAGAVDFYPKPNIASRVVVFDRRGFLPVSAQQSLLTFAKLCFEQKKKMLKKRLAAEYGAQAIDGLYRDLALAEGVRVGQLPPPALLAMFSRLHGISLEPLGISH